MICLDNSVLTRFASSKRYPAVERYLSEHDTEPWTTPATVAYEYYSFFETQSAVQTQQRKLEDRLDGIFPVTDDVATEAAKMEIVLGEQGTSLATTDLLHAATARANGATFVTRDVDDFDKEPIKQLMDIDVIYS